MRPHLAYQTRRRGLVGLAIGAVVLALPLGVAGFAAASTTKTPTTISASVPTSTAYGEAVLVAVDVNPNPNGGYLTFSVDGVKAAVRLVNGGHTVDLPAKYFALGVNSVEIAFSGSGAYAPSSATYTIDVVQAETTIRVFPGYKMAAGGYHLSASLDDPGGVEGQILIFSVANQKLCTSRTSSTGYATCEVVAAAWQQELQQQGSYTVTFAGTKYLPAASATGPVMIG